MNTLEMSSSPAPGISRRAYLRQLAILATAVATGCRSAAPPAGTLELSKSDDAFLEELERATFRFFDECAHPETGLVKDRSTADACDDRPVASIAATGFGLTALCLGDYRGWISHARAREKVLRTLLFLRDRLPHEHGFFFHFVDWRTGERAWQCELSSIDTGLLLCGVLTCRQHFSDAAIQAAADEIYQRVDWLWMAQGEPLLRHGWKPETGFLESRWGSYCELMMLYLLAIAATRHPLPPASWKAWKRPWFDYGRYHYITDLHAPLFIHQYSHAWYDFRGVRDDFADYFENSASATAAHRQFCVSLQSEFPHFGEDLWGITASDSEKGYTVWGGPPRMGNLDGTVVPCAPAGSLPFLPEPCLRSLRTMRDRFGDRAWRRYGFVDAFNPGKGWYNPDVIGIDLGITLLMAENLRSGFVWQTFMKNPAARQGMQRAGFRPG